MNCVPGGEAEIMSPLFADSRRFQELIDSMSQYFRIAEGDLGVTCMGVGTRGGGSWSEAIAAALACRARSGVLVAIEGDRNTANISSEMAVEDFEEGGSERVLMARMSLIPRGHSVLLCGGWVEEGGGLEAAARLVLRHGCTVRGVACVRLIKNSSTQRLCESYDVYAKSMPTGSVPPLSNATVALALAAAAAAAAVMNGTGGREEASDGAPRANGTGGKRRKRPRAETSTESSRREEGDMAMPSSLVYSGDDYGADSERSTDYEMYPQQRDRDRGRERLPRTTAVARDRGGDSRSIGQESLSDKDNTPVDHIDMSSDPDKYSDDQHSDTLTKKQRVSVDKHMNGNGDTMSTVSRSSETCPPPMAVAKLASLTSSSMASPNKRRSTPPRGAKAKSGYTGATIVGGRGGDEDQMLACSTSVYEANNPTEDRHSQVVREDIGVRVYCVSDGHGGPRASQYVADTLAQDVVERIEQMLTTSTPSTETQRVSTEEVQAALIAAFLECDRRFMEGLEPGGQKGFINAGCCVVLALFVGTFLHVAHVGDCRAVLATGDLARADTLRAAGVSSSDASDTPVPRVGPPMVEQTLHNKRVPQFNVVSPPLVELQAVPLTRDHNCDNAEEVAQVRGRSADTNAIRVSRNEQWRGHKAIKRVAGSLAVTRAIGDAYLKLKQHSFSPYNDYVPYITAEPEVMSLELTAADRFLVLASDGVWEQASDGEVVSWVAGSGGTSASIIDQVLVKASASHNMPLSALRRLPLGQQRRSIHDDICATVIPLEPIYAAAQECLHTPSPQDDILAAGDDTDGVE